MLGILICTAIFAAGIAIGAYAADPYDRVEFSVVGGFIGLVLVALLFHPIIGVTGGLFPGYSEGERIGYVTKASTKGVIWKTNEIQVQVGAGEMAALQAPHAFSVPDSDLYAAIQESLGEKVEIRYSEWLIMPYRLGASGYEVTEVRWLDQSPEVQP